MRYIIKGWRNEEYLLTAKELHERIMNDYESKYNWIACATELVRVCSEPDFPKEYAKDIKIAILNCFARLELSSCEGSYRESTDNAAVYYCFNSLDENDENIRAVKYKYLRSIIKMVRLSCFEIPIHIGATFCIFCDGWEITTFEKYCKQKEIDFVKFREEIYADFGQKLKEAESEGLFAAEDKTHLENTINGVLSLISELE